MSPVDTKANKHQAAMYEEEIESYTTSKGSPSPWSAILEDKPIYKPVNLRYYSEMPMEYGEDEYNPDLPGITDAARADVALLTVNSPRIRTNGERRKKVLGIRKNLHRLGVHKETKNKTLSLAKQGRCAVCTKIPQEIPNMNTRCVMDCCRGLLCSDCMYHYEHVILGKPTKLSKVVCAACLDNDLPQYRTGTGAPQLIGARRKWLM